MRSETPCTEAISKWRWMVGSQVPQSVPVQVVWWGAVKASEPVSAWLRAALSAASTRALWIGP